MYRNAGLHANSFVNDRNNGEQLKYIKKTNIFSRFYGVTFAHLHAQLITTSNYNVIANSYSAIHYNTPSQSVVSSAVSW
jgi:hypothetical protein